MIASTECAVIVIGASMVFDYHCRRILGKVCC